MEAIGGLGGQCSIEVRLSAEAGGIKRGGEGKGIERDKMGTWCKGKDTFKIAGANYDKYLGERFGRMKAIDDVEETDPWEGEVVRCQKDRSDGCSLKGMRIRLENGKSALNVEEFGVMAAPKL